MNLLLEVTLVGIMATLVMDFWAYSQKALFGIKSLDYCLVGRWLLHGRQGKLVHSNIFQSSRMKYECLTGWLGHYVIGVGFSILFFGLAALFSVEVGLLFAACFGITTVIMPFFLMQPSFGFGIAASKTPNPLQARVKSIAAHLSFGVGLYLSIKLLEVLSEVLG